MNTPQQVAATILNQLGGNRFIAMTGTKVKYYEATEGNIALTMSLTRNAAKAQYLRVVLTPSDTYTMEFSKYNKNLDKTVCAEFTDVYCDQLQNIFTKVTGLYTSL